MALCKTSLFLPASTNMEYPIPHELESLPISKIGVDARGHSFEGGDFKYLKIRSPKLQWLDRSAKAFAFESKIRFLASFPFDKSEQDLGKDLHFTFPIDSNLQEDIKVIEKELSKSLPDKQLVSCLKEDPNEQCYFTSKMNPKTPVFQEGSAVRTVFKDIPDSKVRLTVLIRLTGIFQPKEGTHFHLTSTIEQMRWKQERETQTFVERLRDIKKTKFTYKECLLRLRAFNEAWISTQSDMRGPFLFVPDDLEPFDRDDVHCVITPSFKARIDNFLVPLFAKPNFEEFIATRNEFLEKEEKEWCATYQTQPEDFLEMNREELYLMYLRDMLSFLHPLHLLFRLISDENKDEVSKEVKAVLQVKPTSTLLKYVYHLLEKHLKPHQPLIFGEEREDITLQPFVSMFWDLHQCECLYQDALKEWTRPPMMPTPQHYFERWRRAFHIWSNDFSNNPHPEIGQYDYRMKKVIFHHMCEASHVLNTMANQFIDASRFLGDIQNTLETFFARYQDAKWRYETDILEYEEEERYSAQTF